MRVTSFLAASLAIASLMLGAPRASAQAPTTEPAPAPDASVSTAVPEEPSLEERRIVAYVATGVAAASLVTGITFGVLAQIEFDCAKDVVACNQGLQNKIVGEELFDVRAEIEQKALAADIAYLFAGAAAIVATVGYLRGFVFVEEDGATAFTAPAPTVQLVSVDHSAEVMP